MLKSMGRSNYHTFRLPYWDWRKERLTQPGASSIFAYDKLGVTNENDMSRVSGQLFEPDWETVCWSNSYSICDPSRATSDHLRRCPTVDNSNSCRSNNPDWPSKANVDMAINMQQYDTSLYGKFAEESFRNFMEGFDPDISREDCAENRLCQCGMNPRCDNETFDGLPLLRHLHNSVRQRCRNV